MVAAIPPRLRVFSPDLKMGLSTTFPSIEKKEIAVNIIEYMLYRDLKI
jgi:hypothetical protein